MSKRDRAASIYYGVMQQFRAGGEENIGEEYESQEAAESAAKAMLREDATIKELHVEEFYVDAAGCVFDSERVSTIRREDLAPEAAMSSSAVLKLPDTDVFTMLVISLDAHDTVLVRKLEAVNGPAGWKHGVKLQEDEVYADGSRMSKTRFWECGASKVGGSLPGSPEAYTAFIYCLPEHQREATQYLLNEALLELRAGHEQLQVQRRVITQRLTRLTKLSRQPDGEGEELG